MRRSAAQHRSRPQPNRLAAPAGTSPFAPWLTAAAFAISVAGVIARAMMTETIRAGSFGAFSAEYTPLSPGPAASLVLDLCFCLPALLVLARRVIDPGYSLRLSGATVPMGLLAIWAAASVAWADDKFSATISAANWCTALVFVWSTSQLVRSWLRLRLVAGACFGLLLVLAVSGWYYRLIDWPELKRTWTENSADMLRQMHKDQGSRDAEQFGKNIASGTPLGFSVSTNTYGALLVLTLAVSAGAALQRLKDVDHHGWIVPIAGVVPLVVPLLIFTQSKAAGATALLGAAAFAALACLGDWPRRHARLAYFGGVAIFLLGAATLVGHGLAHHSLPTSSLAFRWHYWVGSARLFRHHPFIGVGWENFGPHYLAFRLPVAPEEIRDPHNFFVRAFVELGIVGGLLMVAWMSLLWWELTGPLPQTPETAMPLPPLAKLAKKGPRYPAFATVIALAVAAIGLNIAIGFDWAAPGAFLIIEAFKKGFFLLFLAGGMIVGVLRSMTDPALDERPAPWVLTGVLVGLGLFLLHNLIEFSLFEPGAMFLFALLAGSALGIRLVERSGDSPAHPTVARQAPRPRGRKAALVALVTGAAAWLAAGAALAGPVTFAEAAAHDGDEQLRQAVGFGRSLETNGGPSRDPRDAQALVRAASAAAADFESALHAVPYNADYALRGAQAWRYAIQPERALPLLAIAIATDPSSVYYRLTRAGYELEKAAGEANEQLIVGDFRAALELDPNNVAARINNAGALERFGHWAQAAREYDKALDFDSKLSREENKRLPDERVREIQKRRDDLKKAG